MGYIYVRAEYPLAVERLKIALAQASERGLLGKNILGTRLRFRPGNPHGFRGVRLRRRDGAVDLDRGQPGRAAPPPAVPRRSRACGASPRVLNNVETYANVPAIILNGGAWYAAYGTEQSKGTKVFALAGAIKNSGLVEVPVGMPLGDLIYDIGGGIPSGKEFKAAQIGGPSGGCIPKQHLNVPLDYESLSELGAIMGSGGLIVMDEDSCMVDVARFFLEFVQEESCGKCVPCRVGTKRMLEILNRICEGRGEEADVERLIELGEMIKDTSLCGLGQTAPNPVLSTIRHFGQEYVEHIRDKHCRAGVCAALVYAPCSSACPANVDIPGYVSLVAEKRYAEALRLHRERNPFAAVCSRVCFHTCEDKCRRSTVDAPVSIRGIKRFMVDQEVTDPTARGPRERRRTPSGRSPSSGRARRGSPAPTSSPGWATGPRSSRREPRPGGMLVQAIPAYRLPREIVAREVRMIEHMGVEIFTNMCAGRGLHAQGRCGPKATTPCSWASARRPGVGLGMPGEDAEGITDALSFLRTYNLRGSVPVGKNVVVIGGGNSAIDAARTALRLGAENVTVVYRRSREAMPAYEEEIEEAEHEGVRAAAADRAGRSRGSRASAWRASSACPCGWASSTAPAAAGPKKAATPSSSRPTRCWWPSARRSICKRSPTACTLETRNQTFHPGQPGDRPDLGEVDFRRRRRRHRPVVGGRGGGGRRAGGRGHRPLPDRQEPRLLARRPRRSTRRFDPDAEPSDAPREKLNLIPVERRRNNFDEVEQPWREVGGRPPGRPLPPLRLRQRRCAAGPKGNWSRNRPIVCHVRVTQAHAELRYT